VPKWATAVSSVVRGALSRYLKLFTVLKITITRHRQDTPRQPPRFVDLPSARNLTVSETRHLRLAQWRTEKLLTTAIYRLSQALMRRAGFFSVGTATAIPSRG
jgi:hypothetical protein